MNTYVVGHITVKNVEKWEQYRRQVPSTLEPWGAEVVFRGTRAWVLAGEHHYTDTVVLRFPDKEAVQKWYDSEAYQALIPLREQAAEMVLVVFEE